MAYAQLWPSSLLSLRSLAKREACVHCEISPLGIVALCIIINQLTALEPEYASFFGQRMSIWDDNTAHRIQVWLSPGLYEENLFSSEWQPQKAFGFQVRTVKQIQVLRTTSSSLSNQPTTVSQIKNRPLLTRSEIKIFKTELAGLPRRAKNKKNKKKIKNSHRVFFSGLLLRP